MPPYVPNGQEAPHSEGLFPGSLDYKLENHDRGYETLPRDIKLRYKLIQWFENLAQCPLDLKGEFPAWAGWKAVTAATPAVTTPPKGTAGNRTVTVDGLCRGPTGPGIQSSDYTCVRTDYELKLRKVRGSPAYIRVASPTENGVKCYLQDISLYKMADGFVGARFDWSQCTGILSQGALMSTIPQSASMNMQVEEEFPVGLSAAHLTNTRTNFTNFVEAICGGHNAVPVTFNFQLLPSFAWSSDPTVSPACFAESANTGHVLGKACYEDFLFFDLQDVNGEQAKIPAKDLPYLRAMIPRAQHWNHPVPVPAPTPPTPAPPMMSILAPTTTTTPVNKPNPCAPVTSVDTVSAPEVDAERRRRRRRKHFVDEDPCRPNWPTCEQYKCEAPWIPIPHPERLLCHEEAGCTLVDRQGCCQYPTTTTTTPSITDVPGVIIADRTCIVFFDCNCDNRCDCITNEPLQGTTTTTPPIEAVCEANSYHHFWVAFWGLIFGIPIAIYCQEQCIKPGWRRVSKDSDQGIEMPPMLSTVGNSFRSGGFATRDNAKEFSAFVTKTTYSPYLMSLTAAVVDLVIAIAAVYISFFFMWLFVEFIMIKGFGWNQWFIADANTIDLGTCEFTLYPIIVALWLMLWCCSTYYYGWSEEREVTYDLKMPATATAYTGGATSGGGGDPCRIQ
jgi:hypothetical protein